VRDREVEGPGDRVAVVGTALRVAARRADDPGAPAEVRDVRAAEHEHRTGNLVIVAVDTSGSMGADRRIAAAKGAVLGLLTDAYQRRDRVALIAFRGERAELVLRPTASGEIARTRLAELPVGGTTPLADALRLAHTVAAGSTGDRHLDPLLVVITDGRATAGAGGDGAPDPFAQACAVAHGIRRAGVPAVVVDAEAGTVRLGLARELADHLGAEHVALDDLDGHHLERTIRTRLAARPPARA
jgi:magnesium chelatase subunit D